MKKSLSENFNRAAADYDTYAIVQEEVAKCLIKKIIRKVKSPCQILDLGCGTGFVLQEIMKYWPQAELTGLDPSPEMLGIAQRKIPAARLFCGTEDQLKNQTYDLVFSSMMLHWLPHPHDVLQRWKKLLNPGGILAVALLGHGSFKEWADACTAQGIEHGVWNFPDKDFAQGEDVEEERIVIQYKSAHDFLNTLKKTGTTASPASHRPVSSAGLRKLLRRYHGPFAVGYQVLYLLIGAPSPARGEAAPVLD